MKRIYQVSETGELEIITADDKFKFSDEIINIQFALSRIANLDLINATLLSYILAAQSESRQTAIRASQLFAKKVEGLNPLAMAGYIKSFPKKITVDLT